MHCANCKYEFAEGDIYCSKCSQKRHIHLDMGHIVHEFVHNTLHLDGKFFRMLHHVFVPGKVTNDFLAGQQKKYPHPVRFFIVVSGLFLISVLALFGEGMMEGFSTVNSKGAAGLKDVYKPVLGPSISFALRIESFFADSTSRGLPKNQLDSLYWQVFQMKRDSMLWLITQRNISGDGFSITFGDGAPIRDLFVMDPDSLIKKHNLDASTPISEMLTRQGIRATQEPSGLVKRYLGNFAFSIVAMVLLQALIIKLLYFKRKRLYAEHVVYLMHQSVVAMLSLVLISLLIKVFPDAALYIFLAWLLWFFAFGYASMKAVYKQSHLLTSFKYLVFSGSYFFVAFVVLVLNLFLAIVILD